ncbi:protease Lon-related BREX system protein BrxL [Natrialbaceae archaeon AArc-T1-2]|uniref:protease Lon-related BREX system protein BrxL n=1 Tax=Natrialbaceae archaeon AArc-T1-2 TaxID=3053904 RepID=UPI00255AFEE1|nr:protease Lon-related BREX system protein BrxL [Natrialbaceae archaeon AArc-T1-2]WIV67359.1 protease Lon-related BREX system protein BrxL [Natrialbaceae archaeon AArc-T1-2]
MTTEDVDRKALNVFPGRVVRKDLVQDIKSGVNVPTYVLEYLIGQYCATDDEESLEEGLEKVKQILSKHYVRPDEAEFVKSEVRERGRYRVIDKVTVRLDEQQDAYIGSFVNLGLNDVEINEHLVSKHPKLLGGGVWAIIDLEYLPDNANSPKSLFGIDSFKPIQVSNLNLDQLKERREQFTRDEWMDLLLQTVGYDPSSFSGREKFLFLTRCIPLVESNYNFVELGPRGTGKSYLYREISPHSILISGGKTTVAKLFLNLNTGRIGLVGRWDVVAFDEVGGLQFSDSEAVQMLKDYMESGSFSRGTEELTAQASMVYVGNIDLDVEGVLKSSHLFEPFPEDMQDLALIDRFHYYLPGWEVPKMRSEFFGDQFGFIVDYFAEFVRELRKESYGDAINEEFAFGDHLNQRDEKAVRKTVSGLLKLLHPHGQYTKEELREYLEFAMEGRRRVKEQLKRMGGMEYRAVEFSYLDLETKQEIHVSVPEEADEALIPPGTQQAGTIYTIGESGGRHAPFRIETQTLPGSGKTNISGTPGKRMKESFETACDYLQANMRELTREETLDDYNINIQVLNPSDANEGGETSVGLLVGIVSGILDRPVRPQTVVLGSMSLMGELVSVSSLIDKLQLSADSGAKTVLLPAKNKEDLPKIPDELLDQLQLVFYTNPLDAASKAIELE